MRIISLIIGGSSILSAAAAEFHALGDLPGGYEESRATAVLDSGVVVGTSFGMRGAEGFVWTREGGMVGSGLGNSENLGVSADGSVIVGQASGRPVANGETLPTGGSTQALARGVSADGSVIVGRIETGEGFLRATEIVVWRDGEMQRMDDGLIARSDLLDGSGDALEVAAISADGETVVGNSKVLEPIGSMSSAVVWRAGGEQILDTSADVRAYGLSDNGNVVVGSHSGMPCYWTTDGERHTLPTEFDGAATDAAGDGSLIIGHREGTGAFLYAPGLAIESLGDAAPSGWELSRATAISSNGRYVVGYGRNPNGRAEAWLIDRGGSYATWASGHLSGLDAADDADPDGDGYPNLIEYAFGTSPASGSDVPEIVISVVDGAPVIDVPSSVSDEVEIELEFSSDLRTWSDQAASTEASSGYVRLRGVRR